MLVLHPEVVRFGSLVWEDVESVLIDRLSDGVVREWGETGSYARLVDVPRRVVRVRVVRVLRESDLGEPALGELGELVVHTAPAFGNVGRERIDIVCVVTEVREELTNRKESRRVVTLEGVSTSGTDPVSVSNAELTGN